MQSMDGEITVTVKANSIPELVEKLQKILGEYKASQVAKKDEIDFPDSTKAIYPNYEDSPSSAAMLTVLHEKHKGKSNAVDSSDLAQEMKDRFPKLFLGETLGKVSAGNVFRGNFLKEKGLINIEVRQEKGYDYRLYWVD